MPVSSVFLEGPYKVDFKKPWPSEAEQRAAGAEARTRLNRRALGYGSRPTRNAILSTW